MLVVSTDERRERLSDKRRAFLAACFSGSCRCSWSRPSPHTPLCAVSLKVVREAGLNREWCCLTVRLPSGRPLDPLLHLLPGSNTRCRRLLTSSGVLQGNHLHWHQFQILSDCCLFHIIFSLRSLGCLLAQAPTGRVLHPFCRRKIRLVWHSIFVVSFFRFTRFALNRACSCAPFLSVHEPVGQIGSEVNRVAKLWDCIKPQLGHVL